MEGVIRDMQEATSFIRRRADKHVDFRRCQVGPKWEQSDKDDATGDEEIIAGHGELSDPCAELVKVPEDT